MMLNNSHLCIFMVKLLCACLRTVYGDYFRFPGFHDLHIDISYTELVTFGTNHKRRGRTIYKGTIA